MELLQDEVRDYKFWISEFEEQSAMGMGQKWLFVLERWLDRLQEQRVFFKEHRVLALWKCSVIREEIRENVNSRRITDYFECGLVCGMNAGLTRAEICDVAERASRRVAEAQERGRETRGSMGAQSAPTGRPTDLSAAAVAHLQQIAGISGHDLALCREVETWDDGTPLISRTGSLWSWHTCQFCANMPAPTNGAERRWPGHHPALCGRNPNPPPLPARSLAGNVINPNATE
jgi:hypothetical protein